MRVWIVCAVLMMGCGEPAMKEQPVAAQVDPEIEASRQRFARIGEGIKINGQMSELSGRAVELISDCKRVDAETWDAKRCSQKTKRWQADYASVKKRADALKAEGGK